MVILVVLKIIISVVDNFFRLPVLKSANKGAGLVLGMILSGFIIKTVEVDNIMFGREIYFTSYLYASLLTMLFSVIVNAVMSIKIKAVNMVESLKSIE